jgi:hypothetical protein
MEAEHHRLDAGRANTAPWRGPYLSERQWGTVREDYSESGDAWQYFSHDQARSRAYRWGEEGLGGIYEYPQSAHPYGNIVETSRQRSRQDFEYELVDTGVFDQDRYFDVLVEYAKASPEDILVQITVENRGPEPAVLHVLPTVWFRDVWSWDGNAPRPVLRQIATGEAGGVIAASHPDLGERLVYCEGAATLLFTENATNTERLVGVSNRTPFVKDGINSYIVHGRQHAVNPDQRGTKASAHDRLTVGAGESGVVRLRLSDVAPAALASTGNGRGGPFGDFDAVIETRRREADEFYASVIPPSLGADAANVMRQALAGMLWSKQFYYYDVDRWLSEHGADPFSPRRHAPATSTGTTSTTRTSSRCRTSGSTRGTRPGTWPSTSSR